MRADLYVYSDSFKHNDKDSDFKVLSKLLDFKKLTQLVANNENRFLFNSEEFCHTKLLADGTTCGDFLNSSCTHKRDISNLFLSLLTSGVYQTTTFTGTEIDDLLGIHDCDSCSAKIVLYKEDIIDHLKQVLATYDDWRAFRSYFLGLYPGNVDFFYNECRKYYPHLKFGERYMKETSEVLVSHSEKITECLLCLDSFFLEEFKKSQCSRVEFPQVFARNHNIDAGSFEGRKDEKFFIYFQDIDQKLICEPHLKFNTPDESKKEKHNINNYCRIYFNMPSSKEEEVIYVGAIVRHL